MAWKEEKFCCTQCLPNGPTLFFTVKGRNKVWKGGCGGSLQTRQCSYHLLTRNRPTQWSGFVLELVTVTPPEPSLCHSKHWKLSTSDVLFALTQMVPFDLVNIGILCIYIEAYPTWPVYFLVSYMWRLTVRNSCLLTGRWSSLDLPTDDHLTTS